ncbi:MAG: Trm112 family protein [Bacteroidetes bacterium]|jgi:hypothetical protein|nr:Trm112 family protein [Bacteroidota bacterium]
MLAPELLELLCCPKCRADLHEEPSTSELVCTKCGARYPVRDGIPMLLPPPPKTAG